MIKRTILIVEDDEGIAEGLSEFLESENYFPKWAQNGKIALELLAAMDPLPSAIILDLMMPEMDGIGFRGAQLKAPRIAAIPVILVSADPHLETKKLKLGDVQHLSKPIDIDKLTEKLNGFFHS